MNDTAKFTRMHDFLDKPIEQMIAAVDNGGGYTTPDGGPMGFTPALFAGLSAAKVLLAHAQYTEMGDEREGGWDSFKARLQFTCSAVTDAYDSGQPTQFGLWDGLHAAAVEAGRIDGEGVTISVEDCPVAIVDVEAEPPVVVTRVASVEAAEQYLGGHPERDKVLRGGFSIDAPEGSGAGE